MKLFAQYKGLRRANYVLFVGRIVTSLGSMIMPILTIILNQKLGLSATTVATLMVITGILQIPLGLLAGKLTDKYNKRNLIILFDLISIPVYLLCAFLPLGPLTVLLMLIASTSQQMENPAYDALIADLTPTRERERAYSLLYLGGNIGMITAPTLAGLLFHNYLWLSFLISGCSIGLSTLLIFLFIKDTTPVEENNVEAIYQISKAEATLLDVLKECKVVLLYVIIMTFFWCGYSQYAFLMPLDMARIHGDQGALLYGSVTSINCVVVVGFTPLITTYLEKITYTKKQLLSVLFVMLGYAVFLLGMGIIPFYYVSIFLFTLGEILATISQSPYMNERIPSSHRGRINSVMNVVSTVIGNGGMLLIGILYDNISPMAGWVYVIGILLLAGLLNLVLIYLDKTRYPKLYPN